MKIMQIEITTQDAIHIFYCGNTTSVQGIAPMKFLNIKGFKEHAANTLDNEQAKYRL